MAEAFDVIIIGSGPAGLTAGIYAARASLKTLMIAGYKWGGQLMLTSLVENYPGFPEGIMGPELMNKMRAQMEKLGVQVIDRDATDLKADGRPFVVGVEGQEYRGRAVIVATGAEFKWLGLPNEQRLVGRGVSACATCDGAFFKDKKLIVVGGGDSAMEEALYLTKFASELTIVHRREEFRASKIMQDRVIDNSKIKIIWNSEVVDVLGENKVEGVKIKDVNTGEEKTIAVDGVFVAIGHAPATKIFMGKIDLDAKAYALRKENKYRTMSNIEGIFVAGDVHDTRYRQAITAAGYGCEAALEAERWLEENKS